MISQNKAQLNSLIRQENLKSNNLKEQSYQSFPIADGFITFQRCLEWWISTSKEEKFKTFLSVLEKKLFYNIST